MMMEVCINPQRSGGMTLTPNPVLYEYVVFALFKNYSPKSWQSKVKKKKKKRNNSNQHASKTIKIFVKKGLLSCLQEGQCSGLGFVVITDDLDLDKHVSNPCEPKVEASDCSLLVSFLVSESRFPACSGTQFWL